MLKTIFLFPAVLLLVNSGCTDDKNIVYSAAVASPIGPYSQAVEKDGLVYVSGQIALTPDGAMDTSSFETECRRVFSNIDRILKAADKSPADVCKVTVYLTDLGNYSIFNHIYAAYFAGRFPAREVVQVSALPKNVRIEMSLIAD